MFWLRLLPRDIPCSKPWGLLKSALVPQQKLPALQETVSWVCREVQPTTRKGANWCGTRAPGEPCPSSFSCRCPASGSYGEQYRKTSGGGPRRKEAEKASALLADGGYRLCFWRGDGLAPDATLTVKSRIKCDSGAVILYSFLLVCATHSSSVDYHLGDMVMNSCDGKTCRTVFSLPWPETLQAALFELLGTMFFFFLSLVLSRLNPNIALLADVYLPTRSRNVSEVEHH